MPGTRAPCIWRATFKLVDGRHRIGYGLRAFRLERTVGNVNAFEEFIEVESASAWGALSSPGAGCSKDPFDLDVLRYSQ